MTQDTYIKYTELHGGNTVKATGNTSTVLGIIVMVLAQLLTFNLNNVNDNNYYEWWCICA